MALTNVKDKFVNNNIIIWGVALCLQSSAAYLVCLAVAACSCFSKDGSDCWEVLWTLDHNIVLVPFKPMLMIKKLIILQLQHRAVQA